jgi:hypothetical protein
MIVRDRENLDETLAASIVVKVLEELASEDFFQSVVIDRAKFETVVFNYFVTVSLVFLLVTSFLENVLGRSTSSLEGSQEVAQVDQGERVRQSLLIACVIV